jgi:transposase
MPRPSQNYDQEFKEQAVSLLLSSGRPLKRVAADLGIAPETLRSWRDQQLVEGKNSVQLHSSKLNDPAHETRQLRREVEYLRRQRDILKKAMSILSEESGSGMR